MEGAKEQQSSSPKSLKPTSQICDQYSPPPPTNFQLRFPSSVEKYFAPFDDAIISRVQSRTTGAVHIFSTTLTFFTSIEVSLVVPPILYALGYDRAGSLCASVLLVLGIISQIPKKFIFRPRPWMVTRALPIRKDKTSSFPSRAVVCAVVFCWLLAMSISLEGLVSFPLPAVLVWPAIVCFAILTAFARINVGAHYPSDTILGFVLGCVVVRIGYRLEQFWRSTCDAEAAYIAESLTSSFTSNVSSSRWSHVAHLVTARPFWLVTAISYAMTLISIQGFWVKCSYVYGLLMSSATFRATYLCSKPLVDASGVVRSGVFHVVEHGSMSLHLQAGAAVSLLLIFGMITRGKKGFFRIISFTLIYFGSLLAMLSWRVWPNSGA